MTLAHTELATCRDTALDALALNQHQALIALNPSPEVDSLGERIVALRKWGVPEHVIAPMLADLRALLSLNAAEADRERHLTGCLDGLATAAHRASRPGLTSDRPLTLKQLAARIRTAQDDGTLEQLIAETPRARLTSPSMSHELGRRRALDLFTALGAAGAPA